MIISLCGFMGAGKSTIGKNLARYTGYRFIDLDTYIQNKWGYMVSDIFTQIGEQGFRNEELIALQEIFEKERDQPPHSLGLILALGGGTVTTPACVQIIKDHTFCIYLRCTRDILVQRLLKNSVKRPLIAGKSKDEMEQYVTNLMEKRELFYRNCSHFVLQIDQQSKLPQMIDQIVDQIIEHSQHN